MVNPEGLPRISTLKGKHNYPGNYLGGNHEETDEAQAGDLGPKAQVSHPGDPS